MKKTVKVIVGCSISVLTIILAVVFLYNNVIYSKDSHDVIEHFFERKGGDIVADAIINQPNTDTDSVNAYGYNISMVSSIYEKETGIGYFVFEIKGDVEKLKKKCLGNVISDDPRISFGISGICGSSGGEPSFDGDKMYLNYSCVVNKASEDGVYIEVTGDDGCMGRFCITGQDSQCETKKTESGSLYDCVVSPLGIKIESTQYIEDGKSVTVKFTDGTEEEFVPTDGYFPDNGEENIYTHAFDEIKNVKDIYSVIIDGTEYKLA